MDKFEVTVGRLRRFIDDYPALWPAENQGANPHIPGSGWRAEWQTKAASFPEHKGKDAILAQLHCDDSLVVPPGEDEYAHRRFVTWKDTPSSDSEFLPANCVPWLMAFAFCAWDGGRLPTEAEYLFVAAGGDEQRPYPWGADAYDQRTAQVSSYPGNPVPFREMRPLEPVGSRPNGAARWGQLDLLGSVAEHFLDTRKEQDQPLPLDFVMPCIDCMDTQRSDEGHDFRRTDVGDFRSNPEYQQPTYLNRRGGVIESTTPAIELGFRCVREP